MYVVKVETEERFMFDGWSTRFDNNPLSEYKNILSKLFLYKK